ncbi:MAG: hypothetical protein IID45_10250 [Planctomycetes bacterium]|nr:hypothetical protein [Planctomycetota bacterium]
MNELVTIRVTCGKCEITNEMRLSKMAMDRRVKSFIDGTCPHCNEHIFPGGDQNQLWSLVAALKLLQQSNVDASIEFALAHPTARENRTEWRTMDQIRPAQPRIPEIPPPHVAAAARSPHCPMDSTCKIAGP